MTNKLIINGIEVDVPEVTKQTRRKWTNERKAKLLAFHNAIRQLIKDHNLSRSQAIAVYNQLKDTKNVQQTSN